jgi:hypothetical protein
MPHIFSFPSPNLRSLKDPIRYPPLVLLSSGKPMPRVGFGTTTLTMGQDEGATAV